MPDSPDVERSGTFTLGGDLEVIRLGFGAMRVTGRGVWGPPQDREEALAVLRRVVQLGVNLIDTAEAYGPHVSEELIQEALYPYPKGLVIATKAGYDRTGPDEWRVNGRPKRLREGVEGSLRRLRLETIDLWQLHRIDLKVPEDDQFGTIQDLQREGKIRHVGLSEVTIEEIQRAGEYFPVVSVQNQYNLFDRRWEPVLEHCERERIGFIPWYPLRAGRINDEGLLGEIARRHRATPAQIALTWLLQRSPAMLPIPGTGKVAHLEENLGAASIWLAGEEVEELKAMSG